VKMAHMEGRRRAPCNEQHDGGHNRRQLRRTVAAQDPSNQGSKAVEQSSIYFISKQASERLPHRGLHGRHVQPPPPELEAPLPVAGART